MGGADLLIIAIVVVLAVIIGVRYVRRINRGGCNCGCDGGDQRPKTASVTVSDTDEAHYPYALDLIVGGMSCDGCVANVQNALNALPGVWATAQLSGDVHVRGKEPIDQDACESAIKAAGYYVKKL